MTGQDCGMVQIGVPQRWKQAQRIRNPQVPFGQGVNGLHCAASHTQDFPSVAPSPGDF
jgi:hypothetical protein